MKIIAGELSVIRQTVFMTVLCLTVVFAEYYNLPGEELTQEHIDRSLRRVSITNAEPALSAEPLERNRWLEGVMKTWNAQPLSMQQASNQTVIPFGKGGIFVPKMTEINHEPDIEITDKNGNIIASGETGRTYVAEPGEYNVIVGSGSQHQRMIKRIEVTESQTSTLTPDWSGLVIDIVDEQGSVFKGEYELVRIDEFDPYGRGYGASIELGETVKAWILKPGVYKILGSGSGYNTLTDFVTVRLLPGELTNFLLIQDPTGFRIRGGGTVYMTPTTRLTGNWHIGANIGANVQFNAEIDHEAGTDENTFSMGLLFDTWLLYRRKPVEWSTRLRLEESVSVENNDMSNMVNTPDRVNLSSIFIWRLLDWVGPYARAEFNTKFFETKLKRQNESWFCFVDKDYVFNEEAGFDTSRTFISEPAFSPLTFELGAGLNADIATMRSFESKLRLGIGSSYSRYLDRHRIIESSRVKYLSDDSLTQKVNAANSIILYPEEKIDIFEVGPQTALSMMVRLGAHASVDGEIRLFIPVLPEQRIDKPDLDFHGTFSWRLSSVLNLDYTYRRSLKQPAELEVPVHTSSHGIWLRLHFSSR